VTTGGWIALVTLGAIFIGHVFKSGELHYRTIRVIDQVDGRAVAAEDFVCLYSPRTTRYQLGYAPDGWWEPVSLDVGTARGGLRNDLGFNQGRYGTGPGELRVNVWNLRLLQAETVGGGAGGGPLVEADLTAQADEHGRLVGVSGTVKNLSPYPMKNVHIQLPLLHPTAEVKKAADAAEPAAEPEDPEGEVTTEEATEEATEEEADAAEEDGDDADAAAATPAMPPLSVMPNVYKPPPTPMRPGVFVTAPALANIPAGGEVSFGVTTKDPKVVVTQLAEFGSNSGHNYWGGYADTSRSFSESDFVQNVGDLGARRSLAIEAMLKQPDARVACVYAELADPKPVVELKNAAEMAAIQKHYQVVRAVVPLKRADTAAGEKPAGQ
jgi:hypothetical protein